MQPSSSEMWQCTCCGSPPVIDLTEAIVMTSNGIATSSTSSSSSSSPLVLLPSTLQRWGWCHVSVDISRLPQDNPLQCFAVHDNIKEGIVQLFDEDSIDFRQLCNDSSSGIVYRGRTAESGSSSNQTKAEPKQSWEVKRCHSLSPSCPSRHDSDDVADTQKNGNTAAAKLHAWAEGLHTVASTVTKVLSIPDGILLQGRACACRRGDVDDKTQLGDQNSACNIDLLRVFLYDALEKENEEDYDGGEDGCRQLGSSPHTDWGSWTVVWQDGVGGLQTYCQRHCRYVDVDAMLSSSSSSTSGKVLYFVIHVGDITSLALGHAGKAENAEVVPNKKIGCDREEATFVPFPSPQHRVVCPVTEKRASLVYFAYPPPHNSMAEVESGLRKVSVVRELSGVVDQIPYDSYYVLKNQTAADVGEAIVDPQQTYADIRTTPLKEVFDAKWEQVQRG